ncbi:MAG: ATP-binding protein [Thiobacillaceae bacterium]
MHLFHLSLRYKIPLWGSLLIVVSVLAVSAALMVKAYDDLRQDVRISAEGLAYILAQTLFPALLHDDAWRAFEQINAAFAGRETGKTGGNPVRPEAIFVVDAAGRIMVSSHPRELPLLADVATLGGDHARLAAALRRMQGDAMISFDFADATRLFFALPIRQESAQVGILVLAYSKDVLKPRFRGLALYGMLVGGLILAVLLPLNWYWGRRMAAPLVDLARRMGRAVHGGRDDPPHETYPYRDELGQLFEAYDAMLEEMEAKSRLERELLKNERLTAIGRLAAGIAHEVNNPLGGMLLALDTLKARGDLPEAAARTLGLLERGLKQIQETVAALLVQSRDPGRALTAQDLEDVHTLIQPQVVKKSQRLDWQVDMPGEVGLPAAAVRQVLINLLLNAVQATAEQGRLALVVTPREGGLTLEVVNEAPPIAPERLEHLFEPFVSGHDGSQGGGHGLGLWVTYQIVQQLGGRIRAASHDGQVSFAVWLPLQESRT